ncbi:Thioesterase [Pseudomonas aeruginosa]|nr:Thioesterase [Pseudomonas aeruginosa]
MSLWRQTPDLEQLNASQKNSIGDLLGIRFEAFDDESLTASMPVDSRTHQPFGLLHGGASVVLAESLGSMASYLCVDTSQYYCVGLEVNANHLRGPAQRPGHRGGQGDPPGAHHPCLGHPPQWRRRQAELHRPPDHGGGAIGGQGGLSAVRNFVQDRSVPRAVE